MELKMKLITALAVLSTLVAIVEGVLLMRGSPREAAPLVAQGPATTNPPESTQPAAPSRSEEPAPVALPAPKATKPPAPQPEPVLPDVAADSAADSATAEAPPQPELTPEEKEAQEKAEARAKLEEAMTLQMEQGVKQLIDRLALTDAQKQMAAPTIEKLRQNMVQMVTTPMRLGEEMEKKAQETRRVALLTGQSEQQIAEQLKPEQAKLMSQIQDQMTGSLDQMSKTLEELRPILDVRQANTLDQMNKELAQQQVMMKKMLSAVSQAQESAGSDSPSPLVPAAP